MKSLTALTLGVGRWNWLGLLLCLMSCLPVWSWAAPAGWMPLLEPRAAADILARSPEVRVIQVTGNYGRAHMPGALDSPYALWRGPQDNPGALPDLVSFTALLQGLGIDAVTPVLVVHEGANPADMGAATRVYWTLKSLGVRDLAVLNGGLDAWRAAGLPVSNEPVRVLPSTYVPAWRGDWRVSTADVEQLVAAGGARLIDARPPSFFRGFRATVGKPGTIRGAGNLTYESWFAGDRLKPVDELAALHLSYGVPAAPVTVSFCNTGHWASINWFVMSELLAVPNTRLYAESVAEWSQAERPMDNQPNRGRVYRELTSQWLKGLFDEEPCPTC
ncbi:MAG: hypothetical protein RLZZ385_1868 [Pseudomonadota bacterium]|jgi:thiosulfate/3-mercaptopyruvate sulfurtransferase